MSTHIPPNDPRYRDAAAEILRLSMAVGSWAAGAE